MNSLHDVFRLLRNAEAAIRRAGWSPDDYSLPYEIRHIAARRAAGDFQKARSHLKGRLPPAGSPVKLPAVAVPDEHPWRESMSSNHRSYAEGFNACREEMLRNTYTPAPCSMPDDVRAALAGLDASFYRVWAKNRQELTGYIAGDVKPAHLVKVIEWARQNSTAATPRVTEQDAREKVLLEAVFKIEKKYFRTIHDHGATEHAQIILAELRAMVGLPMILKRDLPEWDGVAYVMPAGSNLVANQPTLLKKLNTKEA